MNNLTISLAHGETFQLWKSGVNNSGLIRDAFHLWLHLEKSMANLRKKNDFNTK